MLQAFYKFLNHGKKNLDLRVDAMKIKLQVNALTVEEVTPKKFQNISIKLIR